MSSTLYIRLSSQVSPLPPSPPPPHLWIIARNAALISLWKELDLETPQDTIETSVICLCERSGAKAVLFASDSDIVKLYTPYQVPVNLTIPTLSVQRSISNHILDALSMDHAVTCHFPGSVPPNHWKYDST